MRPTLYRGEDDRRHYGRSGRPFYTVPFLARKSALLPMPINHRRALLGSEDAGGCRMSPPGALTALQPSPDPGLWGIVGYRAECSWLSRSAALAAWSRTSMVPAQPNQSLVRFVRFGVSCLQVAPSRLLPHGTLLACGDSVGSVSMTACSLGPDVVEGIVRLPSSLACL